MFYSYHVPPDFEHEWHTIGEKMERYFAHHGNQKTTNTAVAYAKAQKAEGGQLTVLVKIAAVLLVTLFMLSTLCYFMALDREGSLGETKESPKFEMKSDFFAQAAYAYGNQDSNSLSVGSHQPHYQADFGLPRRFGCED